MEINPSISILIMDDSEQKTTAIINLLVKECGLPEENIETVGTINAGRAKLRNSFYDLLILDLVMPNLDGEEADHDAAPKFIDELYEGHGFKLPNQIIGFTAYEDEYENLKMRFEEKLWSIIKYSQGELDWKERIRAKVNHLLNSKSKLAESIISVNKFDIGIVCALTEEFTEMKKAFGDNKWKRENDIDFPVSVYSTEIVTANANTLKICAVCIGEAGLVPAASMTASMILTFSLDIIFMSGITAGFSGRDLALGDIVISKSVSEPIIGKIVGDDNTIELKREYHTFKTDVKLYGFSQELASDEEFKSDFNKHLRSINLLQGSNLNIVCAPSVSVPFVVGNGALMEKLKEQGDRKLAALDMEGYGMYHSANLLKVPCLWVKSISDLGDRQKDDKYHRLGAFASGYFIYKLIKETL